MTTRRRLAVVLVGTGVALLTAACSASPTATTAPAARRCYQEPTPSPRPPGALGLPPEHIPIDWPGTDSHGARSVTGEDPLAVVRFDPPLASKTRFTVLVTVSADSSPEGATAATAASWSDTTTVTTDQDFPIPWPTRAHDRGTPVAPGRYQARVVLRSCDQTLVTAGATVSVGARS